MKLKLTKAYSLIITIMFGILLITFLIEKWNLIVGSFISGFFFIIFITIIAITLKLLLRAKNLKKMNQKQKKIDFVSLLVISVFLIIYGIVTISGELQNLLAGIVRVILGVTIFVVTLVLYKS